MEKPLWGTCASEYVHRDLNTCSCTPRVRIEWEHSTHEVAQVAFIHPGSQHVSLARIPMTALILDPFTPAEMAALL